MQIGIYTFAETTPDPSTGRTVSAAQRLRDLIEEMELADQVGLDVFRVGEHHRPDFAVSAPAVVLAAGAERTKRIRLTSAATVLFSQIHAIDIAPAPIFAWLEGLHESMAGGVKMFGRMFAGGGVAAADMTTS